MPKVLPLPRKQRTREHVIADLGVNHVERFVFEAGFTAERISYDYGYDLAVITFDSMGFVEPDWIPLQIKAKAAVRETADGRHLTFDLSVADVNNWTSALFPVFLIVFDATRRRAYWLDVQHFFRTNKARRPRRKATYVRVEIPMTQRVNRKWLEYARRCKQNIHVQVAQGGSHD